MVLLDPFGGAIFIFEWSFWTRLVVRSLNFIWSFWTRLVVRSLNFIWSFWTRLVVRSLNFEWSFWTRLVVRSLFLNGPFRPIWWCDLEILFGPFWTHLVVQSLSLILLDLCDRYVGRSVITNMPIYLVHCDLRCHM